LCAAALELLAERGADGVTMRAVAGVVGCGVATPYRYFSDKEDLFTAVRVHGFHRFADRIEAALADVDDPLDRIRAVSRAYLAFAVHEPQAFRVILAVPPTHPPPALAQAVEPAWHLLLVARTAALAARRRLGASGLLLPPARLGDSGRGRLLQCGWLRIGPCG